MTFISTIIANEGIVLSADSKELTQGGQLLWKDFDEILQLKKSHEDDTTLCISPKELTEKFKANTKLTKGRVKNKNGAKKIYQIGKHTAILISGVANPSKQEFQLIIEQIKSEIAASSDNSFTNILNITFSTIEPLITNDKSEDRHNSEYLFCGLDEKSNDFKIYKFFFNSRINLKNRKEPPKKYFHKVDSSVLLNTSGWTNYIGELGTLNRENLTINLVQAFNLSKNIIDLVVTIENITNEITGIGGKIYFAIITKKGFFWVNNETDIMNIIK